MLIVLGLVAGTTGGLLGIGGGVIIVPGLVLLVCFDQHRAHGTSLFSALFLAAVGLARYTFDGNIDFPLAIGIAVGGVTGAVFGAQAARAIRAPALRRVFAAFLLLVSARMIMTGLSSEAHHTTAHSWFPPHSASYWVCAVSTGIATGFVSGLFGVGGGIVVIPAMVLLLAVPQKTAQGVSLAAMIPTAISGVIAHGRLGNVDFGAGKWTGLGAAAGAILGASLASRLANHVLQFAFAGFLVFVAAMMATKKRGETD